MPIISWMQVESHVKYPLSLCDLNIKRNVIICIDKTTQFRSLLLSFWTLSIVRTMDKVQKLNSNECYTPSSEPFRMYTISDLINV
jgi:hypothetical protein